MEQVIFTKGSSDIVSVAKPAYSKPKRRFISIIFSFFLKLLFISGLLFMFLSFPFDIFKQLLPSDVAIFILTLFCGVKLYGDSEKEEGYAKGYNEAIDQMQE